MPAACASRNRSRAKHSGSWGVQAGQCCHIAFEDAAAPGAGGAAKSDLLRGVAVLPQLGGLSVNLFGPRRRRSETAVAVVAGKEGGGYARKLSGAPAMLDLLAVLLLRWGNQVQADAEIDGGEAVEWLAGSPAVAFGGPTRATVVRRAAEYREATALFLTGRGEREPMSPCRVGAMFAAETQAASVEAGFHALRHAFAMLRQDGGGPRHGASSGLPISCGSTFPRTRRCASATGLSARRCRCTTGALRCDLAPACAPDVCCACRGHEAADGTGALLAARS